MSIEALYQKIEEGHTAWKELFEFLVEAKYDINAPRTATEGLSVADLSNKVAIVIETFLAIRPKDNTDISRVIVSARTSEAIAAFENLRAHAIGIANQIRPIWQDGITIVDTNNNFTFSFFLNEINTSNIDFVEYFRQINTSLTELLRIISALLPLCKAKNISDLSQRAQSLAEVISEAETLRNEAKKLTKATEQSAQKSTEQEKLIQDLFSKAEIALSQLQALQVQGNTDSGNVAALVEKIKSTGSGADTLEQQIESYKSTFEAFQTSLDKRNKDFAQFEINSKRAEENNQAREVEIDRLTTLADFMISGATTAGLAKSMEDARSRYETRMNGARKGFYFAVVLLVISAIPLVGHLLPFVGTWFPSLDNNASPYSAIGKVLILVPATWLTAFFTKSYADFFHLEREYAHKAALAMSVDGFKRQARKYEEEITAEVFMEIRSNPANKLGVEPASHPLYNVLSKAVTKVLDRKEVSKE